MIGVGGPVDDDSQDHDGHQRRRNLVVTFRKRSIRTRAPIIIGQTTQATSRISGTCAMMITMVYCRRTP